jgi:plasmid maintenance system antidote protein VapI
MKQRYESLLAYLDDTGVKKNRLALRLGIDPRRLTELLNPEVYRPKVSDDVAERVADVLNQPVSYVRKFYASRRVA